MELFIADKGRACLRPTPVAVSLALMLHLWSQTATARDYFNPALLEQTGGEGGQVDLSTFENGGQLPGRYHADIYLNGQFVESRDLDFTQDQNGKLQPCLQLNDLKSYGVRVDQFPELQLAGERCVNLTAIPQASADFVFSSQSLQLSIPQAAVTSRARDYVSPEQWDEGINAALMNYSFSGSNARQNGTSSDSQYLNLRPGINVGPWRLRNYSTWNRNGDQQQWNNVYTYAQRNIVALKSQLLLGDSSSPADVFDSVPFRGAQLASDDDMLPESQRGYAPVVRGIARSNNAQVIIRQNGYIIYQSYVPAGAFEISDMYPTGGSGDLHVTVKESDGSEQNSVVPFASLPVLQREGRLRFSLTGGQYRAYDSGVESNAFVQGTAIYGIARGTTLYGGTQVAEHYHSGALGLGQNLGTVGAISVDVTLSRSQMKDSDTEQGQSWRLRYSKSMVETGTNVAIAGYRYSTKGFYALGDVMESWRDSPLTVSTSARKNRAEMTISQDLGGSAGYLSLSAIREDYWNGSQTSNNWSVGYNNSWQSVSYSLNYARNQNVSSRTSATSGPQRDDIFSLSISVPLDRWLSNTWSGYSLNSSRQNGSVSTLGVNGVALEDNNLSWSVNQGYGNRGTGYTGYASADYRGTYGQVSSSYSYGNNQSSLSYGMQGAVLAHADGVTLGQPVGETFGLAKVPGASGVSIENQPGVKTDYRGYALVPNLTAYRRNDVNLKTESMKDDVDVQQTSQGVTPTRGAVVRASYQAQVGQRVLMTLTRANGSPVPFGATVSNDSVSSIVGDGGQAYLAGLQPSGKLKVQWGNGRESQCSVDYRLSDSQSGIVSQSARCL